MIGHHRYALPLALAAALVACKSKDSAQDTPAANADNSVSEPVAPDTKVDGDDGPATSPASEEPTDQRAQAVAITKADAAMTGNAAKGSKSLGVKLGKISHLFALDATAKLPDWGAPGEGAAKLARDDDLDTAWRCEFGGDKPCVLGLALPKPAKVEALRVYTAAGIRYRDYKGHPRVAKLRIHTAAGYSEVKLADGANHAYVRFESPVETQSLALEVVETHAGNKSQTINIAEVEVYGTDGVPRAPIVFDPALAWAEWETTTWGGDGDHTIRQVFIYYAEPGQSKVDPERGPARHRFTRATAVFGHAGDDYLLFERLFGTDCDETRGSYLLYDKRNRMFYPLNDLGGAGADVYRHTSGRGFAVGWFGEGEFTVKGIVEEAGELHWKRPPKEAPKDPLAKLAAWGFETKPMSRGEPVTGATPGCHRASDVELDPMIAAANIPMGGEMDPAQWVVCAVGGDMLYASAPCNAPALAYQVADGKLVGKHEGKDADARGLRLRRVGDEVLLELSADSGNTSTLYWSQSGALIDLGTGGLAVRPPSACGTCVDAWVNPHMPFGERIDEDERESEDGDDEALEDDEDEGSDGDGAQEDEDTEDPRKPTLPPRADDPSGPPE